MVWRRNVLTDIIPFMRNANTTARGSQINGIMLSIACIAFLVSLFWNYYTFKSDYLYYVSLLKSYSPHEIVRITDLFDSIRNDAEMYDPESQNILLATSGENEAGFSWLKFQVDYYYYPVTLDIYRFPPENDITNDLLLRTKQGDIIYSVGELNLPPEYFEEQIFRNYFSFKRI